MALPPSALDHIFQAVIRAAESGGPTPKWKPYSEEFYWAKLIDKKPFRSYYATSGGKQPLIDGLQKNLSQTPREQCELEGLVTDAFDRAGPGQEVILHGLQAAAHLNGSTGRVLPSDGEGAPKAAPSAGRVAVRLASGQEVACRPENMRSAHAAAPTKPTSENPALP